MKPMEKPFSLGFIHSLAAVFIISHCVWLDVAPNECSRLACLWRHGNGCHGDYVNNEVLRKRDRRQKFQSWWQESEDEKSWWQETETKNISPNGRCGQLSHRGDFCDGETSGHAQMTSAKKFWNSEQTPSSSKKIAPFGTVGHLYILQQ